MVGGGRCRGIGVWGVVKGIFEVVPAMSEKMLCGGGVGFGGWKRVSGRWSL